MLRNSTDIFAPMPVSDLSASGSTSRTGLNAEYPQDMTDAIKAGQYPYAGSGVVEYDDEGYATGYGFEYDSYPVGEQNGYEFTSMPPYAAVGQNSGSSLQAWAGGS